MSGGALNTACDVVVIGGGIAGASLAYELAADHDVIVLDMEPTLAFHTTGRSAATFLECYGGPEIRALTMASRAYLESPPDVFHAALMRDLPSLVVGREGQADAVRALHDDVVDLVPDVTLLDAREVESMCPLFVPGHVEIGFLEPRAQELDVSAIHQGFVRGLRARGGHVAFPARVESIVRMDGVWTVTTSTGERYRAPTLVNAAGAWVDRIAALAGAAPVGIRPLRRCVFTVAAPDGTDVSNLPLVGDIAGSYYFKPEGPQLLCSPEDETLQAPGNARADVYEIARAIEEINAATILDIRHVASSWAGLRSFVEDGVPVVGWDHGVEGFFWFAGQGGYGIQIAPALAQLGAALLRGEDPPPHVSKTVVSSSRLSPARLAGAVRPV